MIYDHFAFCLEIKLTRLTANDHKCLFLMLRAFNVTGVSFMSVDVFTIILPCYYGLLVY